MKLDLMCNQVYIVAFNEAKLNRHEYLTPEHFLYAALRFEHGKDIISSSGGDIKNIETDLTDYFNNHIPKNINESPTDSYGFVRMLELATAQAHVNGSEAIFLGHMLISIFNLPQSFCAFIMEKNGVLRDSMLKFANVKERKISEKEEKKKDNGEDEVQFLSSYTVELVQKALNKEIDPLIGREEILERTMQVLSRRQKNNPIHVGDPGVGKTAIVEGIALKIANNEKIAKTLIDAKIFYIDMGLLVAGTKYRGDFEERLVKLLGIISKFKNPVIYIDEIHTLVGAGATSSGGMDATSIFKPLLLKGNIKFIGSTTFEEYKKYFEKDRALSRRFQRIDVSEPSIEESIEILTGIKEKYEKYHNVYYSKKIIELICEMSEKHIKDKFMPDKAIDVLDETGAFLRMKAEDDDVINVCEYDIEKCVALIAKVPEKSVTGSEVSKLKNLYESLNKVIFGQEKAIEAVVNAIKAARSGLNDAERPIANFLFVGPTGVGKTEIAKQLALELGINLVRYDMSEYQEKHSVARLIGSPPGYVGFEEGGILTETIKRTPHCVLLLDEIEKAHHDIYNVLLQIMDYGTLTDNMGKKADFKNVILIMTSNAGAKDIGKRIIGYEGKKESVKAIEREVDRIFSPEFRNRLDEIVVFNHIDASIANNIVLKAIDNLSKRLKDKNIKIKASEEAVNFIAKKGLSETYGAREIIRIIEKDIKNKLVDFVLFKKFDEETTLNIDFVDDDIVIKIF